MGECFSRSQNNKVCHEPLLPSAAVETELHWQTLENANLKESIANLHIQLEQARHQNVSLKHQLANKYQLFNIFE